MLGCKLNYVITAKDRQFWLGVRFHSSSERIQYILWFNSVQNSVQTKLDGERERKGMQIKIFWELLLFFISFFHSAHYIINAINSNLRTHTHSGRQSVCKWQFYCGAAFIKQEPKDEQRKKSKEREGERENVVQVMILLRKFAYSIRIVPRVVLSAEKK